jgi:hypothetical protein
MTDISTILCKLQSSLNQLESSNSFQVSGTRMNLNEQTLGYGIETMVKARGMMLSLAKAFHCDAEDKEIRFSNDSDLISIFRNNRQWYHSLSIKDKKDIINNLTISQHNNENYYYFNVLAVILLQIYSRIKNVIPNDEIAECIVQTANAQYGNGDSVSKQVIGRAIEMIKNVITGRVVLLVDRSNSFNNQQTKDFIVNLLRDSFDIEVHAHPSHSSSNEEPEYRGSYFHTQDHQRSRNGDREAHIHPAFRPIGPYDTPAMI